MINDIVLLSLISPIFSEVMKTCVAFSSISFTKTCAYLRWFLSNCASQLQRNLKEIEKKGNNSAKKQFFKNLRKPFLDIHKRNVMPTFENSRLNDVAVMRYLWGGNLILLASVFYFNCNKCISVIDSHQW